jgi:hypothetical protein
LPLQAADAAFQLGGSAVFDQQGTRNSDDVEVLSATHGAVIGQYNPYGLSAWIQL